MSCDLCKEQICECWKDLIFGKRTALLRDDNRIQEIAEEIYKLNKEEVYMPEVIVKCGGCGIILDVEDVALDYGDFCLVMSPCTCVLEEYQEREPVGYE